MRRARDRDKRDDIDDVTWTLTHIKKKKGAFHSRGKNVQIKIVLKKRKILF
jgi:hypothetical protein